MDSKKSIPQDGKGKRTVVGSIIAGLFGALGVVYLINPTAGFIELIPDNLPVVGNLDEAAAVLLVISCLTYFGIDLGGLLGRKTRKEPIIDVDAEDR